MFYEIFIFTANAGLAFYEGFLYYLFQFAESVLVLDRVMTPILHFKAKTATQLISGIKGKSGFDFYMCKIKV